MRRLLDGSTHCARGCSTGAPVSGPENVFETSEKSELKELSECAFSVTPGPDEVHSTCNCKGAYVYQVPL